MGLLGGEPKMSTSQSYDKIAMKDYKKKGYKGAVTYWQYLRDIDPKHLHKSELKQYGIEYKGGGLFSREFAATYMKSIAPNILKRLERLNRQEAVLSPSPVPASIEVSSLLGSISRSRSKSRRYGRGSTILTGLGGGRSLLLGGNI
jgi:hypothetical protein